MAKRYRDAFKIFKTEEEAAAFCEDQNRKATRYARDKHPAHYTPWSAPAYHYEGYKTVYDGYARETGFIAWYVY